MRVTILLAALLTASCLGPAQGNDVTATPQLLSADPNPPSIGEVTVLGILRLQSDDSRFGGLSAMALDGDRVTALSDKGDWLSFDLRTDAAGRPLSVGGLRAGRLGGLSGAKDESDAEGLAMTPQGPLVSFERRHRLALYADGWSKPPRAMVAPAGMADLPFNGGVEAVARLGDGRLLLVGEDADDSGHSPAWIGRSGDWHALSIRRDGIFHPTAAAVLPDGDVLLLERAFSLLGGMQTRLVRLPASALIPGTLVQGRQIMRLGPPLLVDNYEALAVRKSANGAVVAYLLSDDNFNPLQATLLMAVVIPQ